jgi:hypothetical protein
MRKALLVVLILSSVLSWAQGGCTGQKPLNGMTTGGFLKGVANASVRVCSDTLTPCTTIPLYSDAALTQSLSNPVTTDAAGNYQYCAAPGNYNEQISGSGISGSVNNTPVGISLPVSADCVEYYLTPAMNGDYGQAINAANSAKSLTTPSQLRICNPGDHQTSTTAIIDRPIHFSGYGARLVPTSTLAATPVTLSSATLTAGSTTVTVTSTTGLVAGMAVGGTGVQSTSYIASVTDSTHFVMSLPARLVVNGKVTASSTTVSSLSSMVGLTVGQTLVFQNQATPIAIDALTPASQSLTLHSTPSVGAPVPFALEVGGTITSTIMAVAQNPVMVYQSNGSALQNAEGQMIGGSINGLSIADTTANSDGEKGRTLSVQGLQIAGWDGLEVHNFECHDLKGSCLILGGPGLVSARNKTVREVQFFNTQLRDSGDGATGQSELEIMSPPQGNSAGADEINQIAFHGSGIVFPHGEAVTIGTYNTAKTTINGPRLIWFGDNSQIEAGEHVPSQFVAAPFDLVHILQANATYFNGSSLIGAGYGKALIAFDYAGFIGLQNAFLYPIGKTATYTVTATNGSPTLTYVSGGNGGFDATGQWNGIGMNAVDGVGCTSGTPCNVYAAASSAVNGAGTTLTLAGNWSGASGSVTLTVGIAGYYFQKRTSDANNIVYAMGNSWNDPAAAQISLLGVSSANSLFQTGYFFGPNLNDRGGLNITQFTTLGALLQFTVSPVWPNSGFNNTVATATLTGNRQFTLPNGDSGPVLAAGLSTAAATSDTVTIQGLTTSGRCWVAPTNASAATNLATTYVQAPISTPNQVTITHTATAGMTYNVSCKP